MNAIKTPTKQTRTEQPLTSAERCIRNVQPLDALQLPDALLQIQVVVRATGLSVTTIYRKVAAGELAIVKMGKRCTRFRAADVRAFIHAQGVAA
jgi:prophage regulatory protein